MDVLRVHDIHNSYSIVYAAWDVCPSPESRHHGVNEGLLDVVGVLILIVCLSSVGIVEIKVEMAPLEERYPQASILPHNEALIHFLARGHREARAGSELYAIIEGGHPCHLIHYVPL